MAPPVQATVDWEDINRRNWDERAPLHAASADYNIKDFVEDANYLSEVVNFDLPLLGDVTGQRIVHLQCHIGTDTLSLARRGASAVTGLDFSGASLAEARKLAEATKGSGGEKLDFVEASVYDSLKVLPNAAYDIVFTGIGALCWIPDIAQWAGVVAGLLKPGGRLFIREGHPMLWAMDDKDAETLTVKHPYFERGGVASLWDEGGTYVEHEEYQFKNTATAEFNHGIGEIIQALLDAGLRITGMKEHQTVSWDALPGQMEDIGGGEYKLKKEPWRLPLTYTLQAVKE